MLLPMPMMLVLRRFYPAATTFLSFIDPGENVFLIFTIVSSLQYGLERGQCLSLSREGRSPIKAFALFFFGSFALFRSFFSFSSALPPFSVKSSLILGTNINGFWSTLITDASPISNLRCCDRRHRLANKCKCFISIRSSQQVIGYHSASRVDSISGVKSRYGSLYENENVCLRNAYIPTTKIVQLTPVNVDPSTVE